MSSLMERLDAVGGTERCADLQHARGKQTARERVDALLDEGSFIETDALARHRSTTPGTPSSRPYGDGLIAGRGTVDGRDVCVYAQDATVFDGRLGEVAAEKIGKVLDLALTTGCPVIGINDSAGVRVHEGLAPLGASGALLRRQVRASGVIPQISLVMGPCLGEAAYSPAVADFTVMVDQTAHLLVAPAEGTTITDDGMSLGDLGGALAHATSGSAHHLAPDDAEALEYVRALLSYLPQNNLDQPPMRDPAETAADGAPFPDEHAVLDTLVPDSPVDPFDMLTVVDAVVDPGTFLEVHELFAPNLVVGLARVEDRSVGVVANQPLRSGGALNAGAAEKAARFVRTCDAFNLPVLTFVDVPGYVPGTGEEQTGLVRRGAKLVYAYAEATVPLVSVVVRNASGGTYNVMGSKQLGADVALAWPTARMAAVALPAGATTGHVASADAADAYAAAERGHVDAVIAPRETRRAVVRALRMLRNKREALPPKKHGNIPL
jgi:propionyl-CoA carboxylase beta chain